MKVPHYAYDLTCIWFLPWGFDVQWSTTRSDSVSVRLDLLDWRRGWTRDKNEFIWELGPLTYYRISELGKLFD